MNVPQLISELLSERERLDEEILALEQMSVSDPKKRGRPRKRVTEIWRSQVLSDYRQRDVPTAP